MRPRNRHELEAMGCVALFALVILTLVSWSLYEHGYLGIAVAVVGGVTVFVVLIRKFRAWVARRDRVDQRRHRQEEEQQLRLGWEQERRGHEDRELFVPSVSKERSEEEQRRSPLERGAIIERISDISDGEFEQLMAYYFRQQGYVVDTGPATDGRGADLLIAASDRRISVGLKRQEEGIPVGARAIQEALAGRVFYGAYETWLVTNSSFTRTAWTQAGAAGVRLIDGDELVEWLEELLERLEDEP